MKRRERKLNFGMQVSITIFRVLKLIKSSKDLKIACVLIENILISSRVIFLVHWDVE